MATLGLNEIEGNCSSFCWKFIEPKNVFLIFSASSGSSGAFPGETDYYPGSPIDENPFKNKNMRKPYNTDTFDINTYDEEGREKPELTPTQTHEEDQFERKMNTQSSSMLLYMVLGIVLGVMMLLLVIFMVMCGLKQRQQRRMMGTS
jgi:hypothetical protein